ncbi:Pentapeptide_repeats-containing protein [Hexamita inflata]|uniref:Pentapeptide repeats-containing protein n=1 Tax=Hexamita inflata TaxID=28002 RepID=A0AA86PXD8_9EUKA|nr:Pentapeptide repeats-containing protein [Hexamita inflata]
MDKNNANIQEFGKLIEKLHKTGNGYYSKIQAVIKLEKVQINKFQIIDQPTKILDTLLDISMNMEGYNVWQVTKVISVVYQMIFRVYILCDNPENNIALYQDSQSKRKKIIEQIGGLIKKKHPENKLAYYLDIISSGVNSLDDSNDFKKYFADIFNIIFSCIQRNYDQIVKSSLEIIQSLKEQFDKKVNQTKFQKILSLQILTGIIDSNLQQQVLDYIRDFIEINQDGDWQLIYAALDIIQVIFRNVRTMADHPYLNFQDILKQIRELSQLQNKYYDDTWRIREKIAEICVINCCHVHNHIQYELAQTYKNLKNTEIDTGTGKFVRQTLNNERLSEEMKNELQNEWDQYPDTEQTLKELQDKMQLLIDQNANNQKIKDDYAQKEFLLKLDQIQKEVQSVSYIEKYISQNFSFIKLDLHEVLYQQFDQLQNQISQLIQQLINQLNKNGAKIDQVDQKIDKNGAKIDQVDQKIDKNGAKIDQVDQKIDKNGAKIDQVDQKIDKNGAKIDQVDQKIDKNGAKIDQVDQKIDKNGAKIDQVDQKIDQNGAKIDQVDQKIDQNGAKINQVDQKIDKNGAKIDQVDQKIDQNGAKIDQVDQKIDKNGAKIDQTRQI